MTQCAAITKKGQRCKNKTKGLTIYCTIHSISNPSITSDNTNSIPKKDFWDKISSLSTLLSGVLIAGIGLWATHHYNYSQLELRQLEALDKFRPLLSSNKPDEREFAYSAFVSLGYENLALKLIALKDDRAGINVLASLSKSENQEISSSATKILSKLKIQTRFGGKKATISRLKKLHPSKQFEPDSVFSVLSFSLRSFNIFKHPARIEHISKVIKGVESEIILVQEIPNLETVRLISSFLNDYEFVINAGTKSGPKQFQVTFLKKGKVKLLDSFTVPGEFIRLPICVTTSIKGQKVDIVNLHLTFNKRQHRTLESVKLLSWERKRTPQRPVIISGVFNAEADDKTLSDLHEIGRFATKDMDKDASTLVRGHRKYTHFLMGDRAEELYISKSIFVYDLKKYLPELSEQVILKEISDHNPVQISLLITEDSYLTNKASLSDAKTPAAVLRH